ncbi:MAG TPA: FMN-binding glutamate synthase family protein [Gammaproteobacteria bacterium]|nr:FMN-binding glutamate synthase family protein [Gammaproteobacteria bacterium]
MESLLPLIEGPVFKGLILLAGLFILFLGTGFLLLLSMAIVDRIQTKQAIRRNFPLVGRFRYLFEKMGEFFRQYFFALDREEMPFNRAQRSWAYRAAKNLDNTVAFGSTKDIKPEGTILFVNCPYPTLDSEAMSPSQLVVGPYCRTPYHTDKVLHISGMSYGAISKPAVIALSKGAAMAGCWLNTGEGGLSPYHLSGGADLVFQIGTAKYGVRHQDGSLNPDALREIARHEQVRMFEVKLSQGAKPGKGGILPAEKVTEEIARIRGIEAGKASISPNRHVEVTDEISLLQLVQQVREITGKPVGIKFVLGAWAWLDDLFSEVSHRGLESAPDFISLDSADGGTGAAPMSLMDDVGMSVRESLPFLVDKLEEYGLRERIKVIASGKLITPSDIAWALCIGADFVVSARGFMFALGCIQAMQCNKNTCPSGVATHDKRLQRGLVPKEKAMRVANYQMNMEKELGIIAHSCGVKEPRRLKRYHARVVTKGGQSVPLDEWHTQSIN